MSKINASNVFRSLGNGFNNKSTFPDVHFLFKTSKNVVYAHKFILSQNSECLQACFNSNMTESTSNQIIIDDEEDDERLFTNMIQCMYTGELLIESQKDIVPLLCLVDKYQIIALERLLADYLADNLDSDNVLECWRLDSGKEEYEKLFDRVKKYMLVHSRNVLRQDTHISLDYHVWYDILSVLVTSTTADIAYDAMERWIDYDEENRCQYSYALLKLINSRKKENHMDVLLSPSLWTFDRASLPSNVTLSNSDRTVTSTAFNYDKCVWINVPLKELNNKETKWKILINHHNCWIGIGVGLKTLPVKSGWTACKAHGLFLYSTNGYSWSHSVDSENAKPVGMKASVSDLISVTYSPAARTLTIMRNNIVACTLSNVDGDLYPVVVPANETETVTIMNE
jgi:hypothetical protein